MSDASDPTEYTLNWQGKTYIVKDVRINPAGGFDIETKDGQVFKGCYPTDYIRPVGIGVTSVKLDAVIE